MDQIGKPWHLVILKSFTLFCKQGVRKDKLRNKGVKGKEF